jgi:hypothetical protein
MTPTPEAPSAHLAGRAGPAAQLLARHETSTGRFLFGLGPLKGATLVRRQSRTNGVRLIVNTECGKRL